MSEPRLVRRCAAVACAAVLILLGACERAADLPPDELAPLSLDRPAAYRADGPRLPAFSGLDPTARGWVKVDDLLWLQAEDVTAYRQGLVFDGTSHVPVDRPLPEGAAAEHSFRIRTDHVAVHTDAAWSAGLSVAREAEAHVRRLVSGYGDALDLRLPAGPLKIVVTARRAELTQILQLLVRDPVAWGAFYDARTGNMYVSLEPAPAGTLPWEADLRHEMTHQILDLSRPEARRMRTWAAPWFWLWEGIAVWSESLGGSRSGQADRIGRFQRRYAWNDWVPLAALGDRPQDGFEGKHYDQMAHLMTWLLDPRAPARRAGMFDIVRRLQHGPVPAAALEAALGMPLAQAEDAWRATVGR